MVEGEEPQNNSKEGGGTSNKNRIIKAFIGVASHVKREEILIMCNIPYEKNCTFVNRLSRMFQLQLFLETTLTTTKCFLQLLTKKVDNNKLKNNTYLQMTSKCHFMLSQGAKHLAILIHSFPFVLLPLESMKKKK